MVAKAVSKVTKELTIKKLITGMVTSAVVIGGVLTAVILNREPEPKPIEAKPTTWVGYGKADVVHTRRFELNIEKMNDDSINGHLEVSYLFELKHDTDFKGVGTEKNGMVVYEIEFDTPALVGTIPRYEYKKLELEYDKENDRLVFNSRPYRAEMERVSEKKAKTIAKNTKWSGLGEDGFYNISKKKGHLFELDVEKMTESEISGSILVSYEEKTDHQSKFAGRGYVKDGVIYYEILLNTPRTESNIINTRVRSVM